MKAVVMIALLAACCAAENLVLKEAVSYRADVPKNGRIQGSLQIDNPVGSTLLTPALEFHVEFVYSDTGRTIGFAYGNEASLSENKIKLVQFGSDANKDATLSGFNGNCDSGCTVHFFLNATCDFLSCKEDVTIIFWYRIFKETAATGDREYFYSTDKLPYVQLHEDFASAVFEVAPNHYAYFSFDAPHTGDYPLHFYSPLLGYINVVGSDFSPVPTKNGGAKWFRSDSENGDNVTLTAGMNYIGVYGEGFSGSAEFALCIGYNCDPASVTAVSALLLLFSALASYLFC